MLKFLLAKSAWAARAVFALRKGKKWGWEAGASEQKLKKWTCLLFPVGKQWNFSWAEAPSMEEEILALKDQFLTLVL